MDVAIVTDDATIVCVMAEDEYRRLAADWVRAVARKFAGPRAGCYWMTVEGQVTNHGLLLTNVTSLTGVLVTEKTESAT